MTRHFAFTALALSVAVAFTASTQAAQPLVQIGIGVPAVQPPSVFLPKFGFQSFNLSGIGDRVTFVDCHGLAAEMGLEPGDIVLRLNGMPLSYHGAWNQALTQAMYDGGVVTLAIRDVNTGAVVHRTTYLTGDPGYGPITPKSYPVTQKHTTQKFVHPGPPQFGQPMPIGVPGPITQKSMNGNKHNNNLSGPKGLKANAQSFQKFGKLVQKIGE